MSQETRVEEMTQIERFEDIETQDSQELPVTSQESGVKIYHLGLV